MIQPESCSYLRRVKVSVRRLNGAVSRPDIELNARRFPSVKRRGLPVKPNGQKEACAPVRKGGDAAMRLIYAEMYTSYADFLCAT